MRNLILAFIAVMIIAGACGRFSDESVKSSNDAIASAGSKAEPETEPPLILGEARKPIVAAATQGLDLERDKVEKISFYSAKNRNLLQSRLEAYISLPDDMRPLLRMKSTYYGDDWVFYDSIKIMADDVVVYEHDFGSFNVVRNNSSGSVWETADILASPAELAALKAVANSKSATIRFSGRERRDDHEIGKKERQDLKKVIGIYEKLSDELTMKSSKV